MAKWIDAEEIVHVTTYDEEKEAYTVETCTIEEVLDKHTDEGCPVAADVAPVRRGRWEMKPDPFGFFNDIPVCSECGCTTKMRDKSAYCPNCGARMDQGDNDGEEVD